MSQNDMIELIQLAEVLCPAVLLDIPVMTIIDLHGVLFWLRNHMRTKEVTP